MKLLKNCIILLTISVTTSQGALTLLFGNNAGRLTIPTGSTTNTTSIDGDGSDAFTTGTLTESGVTFDLTITSTGNLNTGNIGLKPNITDGGATQTFSISNVTGLAPGQGLVFQGLSLTFVSADDGVNGEGYVINGIATETPIVISSNEYSIPDFPSSSRLSTFTVGAQDFGAQDTSFQVGRLEFAVVPEPSATLLLGLSGLALITRRKR